MTENEKKQLILTRIQDRGYASELDLYSHLLDALRPDEPAFAEHIYLINSLKEERFIWETDAGVITLTSRGIDLFKNGGYIVLQERLALELEVAAQREMDKDKLQRLSTRAAIFISIAALIVSIISVFKS